jgi:hypothetical protein
MSMALYFIIPGKACNYICAASSRLVLSPLLLLQLYGLGLVTFSNSEFIISVSAVLVRTLVALQWNFSIMKTLGRASLYE